MQPKYSKFELWAAYRKDPWRQIIFILRCWARGYHTPVAPGNDCKEGCCLNYCYWCLEDLPYTVAKPEPVAV